MKKLIKFLLNTGTGKVILQILSDLVFAILRGKAEKIMHPERKRIIKEWLDLEQRHVTAEVIDKGAEKIV